MCITINELHQPLHDEDPHVLEEYVHLLHQDDPMRFKNTSIECGSKNWSSNMCMGLLNYCKRVRTEISEYLAIASIV